METEHSLFSIDECLKRIRPKLPPQGPISSFLHLNILEGYEHLEFFKALEKNSEYFQSSGLPSAEFYQSKLSKIEVQNFLNFFPQNIPPFLASLKLEFIVDLMFANLKFWHKELIYFYLNESPPSYEGLFLFFNKYNHLSTQLPLFSNDLLTGLFDHESSTFFLQLMSSYYNQGISFWSIPSQKENLLLHYQKLATFWNGRKFKVPQTNNSTLIIHHHLEKHHITVEHAEEYLLYHLMQFRGWSSVVSRLESNPQLYITEKTGGTLKDLIAILLLIKESSPSHNFEESIPSGDDHHLQSLFICWQIQKINPDIFSDMDDCVFIQTMNNLMEFYQNIRPKLFQLIYERQIHNQLLNSITQQSLYSLKQKQDILVQFFYCIDDREESIRRHTEKIIPQCETFGVVGFFNTAIKYQSVAHPRPVDHCPPVISPQILLQEKYLTKKSKRNNQFPLNAHLFFSSRLLLRGYFINLFLGLPALMALIFKFFIPYKWKLFSKHKKTNRPTQILVHRHQYPPQTNSLLHTGFTKIEMSEIVFSLLSNSGVTKLAETVFIVGHVSNSYNNPYLLAYGCGACGGRSGAPNARVFCSMANDPEVRTLVAEKGLNISPDTLFVPLLHDTCSEKISLLDPQNIPHSHKHLVDKYARQFKSISAHNALEKSVFFEDFTFKKTLKEALQFVQWRSFSSALTIPEYGHCTNSFCVIGPRELTKQISFARKSFLVSYDEFEDPTGIKLKKLMIDTIPVCANINLDYYFSTVNNETYGAGSKLPLNITGAIGVMTGTQSDLRLGLPRQAVSIHTPVRIMIAIFADAELIKEHIKSHPRLFNLVKNNWILITSLRVIDQKIVEHSIEVQ